MMQAVTRNGWLVGGLVFWTLTALMTSGCGSAPDDPWPDKPGPRVLVSFAPLASLAANVAGDDASVLCLLSTTGPHHFSPTPHDVSKLQRADLFLINGLGMDDRFCTKLRDSCGNKKLTMVKLGEAIPTSQLRRYDEAGHDAHHEHGPGCCHHGEYDPHVWLGIPEAILMVKAIRDELKQIDSAHASGYDQRAEATIARLRQLQEDGMTALQDKKDKNLLTFHDSLHYFARTFGLNVVDSIEPRAGEEPSSAKLTQLVDTCLKHHVRVLAVEPQYPKNTSAKALLDEIRKKGLTDAVFVEVDPLETATFEELAPDQLPRYYETKMRANIQALANHLR
ncbi:MAG: metal ABC transporter substrate-binding protein [Gemmataceae bacterium]